MGKKVTIQDIAEATGISKSTVSRVVSNHGYVNEKTRTIVMKCIKELGYRPQQKHKGKHVRDLVMIASGLLSSPIQITITENIIRELESNGFKAMISYNDFDTYKLEEHLLYARDRELAGIVILGLIETPRIINLLKTMKCPVVLLNQDLKGLDVNIVGMDDFRGGYVATKYLIEKGHSRIGLLMGYEKATAIYQRETGFREAMKDSKLKIKDSDIFYGDFTEKGGINYAKNLIDKRDGITGIISCNDLMSVGLIQELIRSGFKIPEDFSVVGFDYSSITKIMTTKLTTINYDFSQIGITAANMILEDIKNPLNPKRKINFSPTLLEKESVKELY